MSLDTEIQAILRSHDAGRRNMPGIHEKCRLGPGQPSRRLRQHRNGLDLADVRRVIERPGHGGDPEAGHEGNRLERGAPTVALAWRAVAVARLVVA